MEKIKGLLSIIKAKYKLIDQNLTLLFFGNNNMSKYYMIAILTSIILKLSGAGTQLDFFFVMFVVFGILNIGKLTRGLEDFEQAIPNIIKKKIGFEKIEDIDVFTNIVVVLELILLFFTAAMSGFFASILSIAIFADLLGYYIIAITHEEYKEISKDTKFNENSEKKPKRKKKKSIKDNKADKTVDVLDKSNGTVIEEDVLVSPEIKEELIEKKISKKTSEDVSKDEVNTIDEVVEDVSKDEVETIDEIDEVVEEVSKDEIETIDESDEVVEDISKNDIELDEIDLNEIDVDLVEDISEQEEPENLKELELESLLEDEINKDEINKDEIIKLDEIDLSLEDLKIENEDGELDLEDINSIDEIEPPIELDLSPEPKESVDDFDFDLEEKLDKITEDLLNEEIDLNVDTDLPDLDIEDLDVDDLDVDDLDIGNDLKEMDSIELEISIDDEMEDMKTESELDDLDIEDITLDDIGDLDDLDDIGDLEDLNTEDLIIDDLEIEEDKNKDKNNGKSPFDDILK